MNPRPTPEDLLGTFLEAHPTPSPAEVEALCTEHPDHASDLRRLLKQAAPQQPATDPTATLFHPKVTPVPTASGPWSITPGQVLGDFTLIQRLGRGGMGEVWEAQQESLGRKVALKLLLPDRVDQNGLEFFAREARAGGRLAHPGIISVFGTGEADGLHWISMELIEDACDLRHSLEEIREETELPEDYYPQVAQFTAEVADALEAAHASHVIHRDLKPGNIMVTPDEHPKVADFGLAKLVDENSLSVAGDVAGTYFYMSPEQVATKRAGLDHRTDIFSLGVVLYEMLTLVRPFEGDTTEQVAQKILWEEAPNPSAIRSKVPRDLAVICGKAMEKDPGRRYQTMADLAADLRRHLANEPILAKPSGTLVRLQKWVRRNPTKSVAAAITLLGITFLSVLLAENIKQRKDIETALDVANHARLEADEALVEIKRTEETTRKVAGFLVDLLAVAEGGGGMTQTESQMEMLARGKEWLEGDLRDHPRLRMMLQSTIGDAYVSLGKYRDARPLLEDAAVGHKEVLGPTHVNTLAAMKSLGGLYYHQGSHEKAESIYREVLEIYLQTLGPESSKVTKARHSLGRILVNQGKWKEAEQLYLQTITRGEELFGDKDPETLLDYKRDLGELYIRLGRLKEAERVIRPLLEDARLSLGPEHPTTIHLLGSLAELHQENGNYTEAAQISRSLVALKKTVFGPEHPTTISSMSTLASMLDELKQYHESEPIHEEVLSLRRTHFGEAYPDTITAMVRLAGHHHRKGDYDKAEPLYLEAVSRGRETQGEEGSATQLALTNLSALYLSEGRYEEAQPMLLAGLEYSTRVFGADSRATFDAMHNLAVLYRDIEQWTKAEGFFTESYEGKLKLLGPAHPGTLNSASQYAGTLSKQGLLRRAGTFLHKAIQDAGDKLKIEGLNGKAPIRTANTIAWSIVDPAKSGNEGLADLALLLSKETVKWMPESKEYWDTLAWAYLLNGMYTETEAAGQKALELTEEGRRAEFMGYLEVRREKAKQAQAEALLKQDR